MSQWVKMVCSSRKRLRDDMISARGCHVPAIQAPTRLCGNATSIPKCMLFWSFMLQNHALPDLSSLSLNEFDQHSRQRKIRIQREAYTHDYLCIVSRVLRDYLKPWNTSYAQRSCSFSSCLVWNLQVRASAEVFLTNMT